MKVLIIFSALVISSLAMGQTFTFKPDAKLNPTEKQLDEIEGQQLRNLFYDSEFSPGVEADNTQRATDFLASLTSAKLGFIFNLMEFQIINRLANFEGEYLQQMALKRHNQHNPNYTPQVLASAKKMNRLVKLLRSAGHIPSQRFKTSMKRFEEMTKYLAGLELENLK